MHPLHINAQNTSNTYLATISYSKPAPQRFRRHSEHLEHMLSPQDPTSKDTVTPSRLKLIIWTQDPMSGPTVGMQQIPRSFVTPDT